MDPFSYHIWNVVISNAYCGAPSLQDFFLRRLGATLGRNTEVAGIFRGDLSLLKIEDSVGIEKDVEISTYTLLPAPSSGGQNQLILIQGPVHIKKGSIFKSSSANFF